MTAKKGQRLFKLSSLCVFVALCFALVGLCCVFFWFLSFFLSKFSPKKVRNRVPTISLLWRLKMTFLIRIWRCWFLELPSHPPRPLWSCMPGRWKICYDRKHRSCIKQGFDIHARGGGWWWKYWRMFNIVLVMIWNLQVIVIVMIPICYCYCYDTYMLHQRGFQYPCRRWRRKGCQQSCNIPMQSLDLKACSIWLIANDMSYLLIQMILFEACQQSFNNGR